MRRQSVIWALVILVLAGSSQASQFGLGGKFSAVRNPDPQENTTMVGGMARLRGQFLGLEADLGYRKQRIGRFQGDPVDLKTWPVTLSALLYPLPTIYGLAGFGWHNATVDLPDRVPFDNRTETKLGYHVGAGLEVPLAPRLGFIGDARFYFLDYEFAELRDLIGDVDADYFTLNFGAIVYF